VRERSLRSVETPQAPGRDWVAAAREGPGKHKGAGNGLSSLPAACHQPLF